MYWRSCWFSIPIIKFIKIDAFGRWTVSFNVHYVHTSRRRPFDSAIRPVGRSPVTTCRNRQPGTNALMPNRCATDLSQRNAVVSWSTPVETSQLPCQCSQSPSPDIWVPPAGDMRSHWCDECRAAERGVQCERCAACLPVCLDTPPRHLGPVHTATWHTCSFYSNRSTCGETRTAGFTIMMCAVGCWSFVRKQPYRKQVWGNLSGSWHFWHFVWHFVNVMPQVCHPGLYLVSP